MRNIACLMAVLALAACSGAQSNLSTSVASSTDPAQQISTFVVADLQAADTIAKANNDTVGATCFEYLIPKVQALQSAEQTSKAAVAGAVSFAEVDRGITVQLNNAKSGLNVACAPLVLDTVNTAAQLAAQMGSLTAAVASGGSSLLLP